MTLADEIDTSRGDVIADAGRRRLKSTDTACSARVVWMGKEPLRRAGSYLIKLGTCSARRRSSRAARARPRHPRFRRGRAAVHQRYRRMHAAARSCDRGRSLCRRASETGSFILIDPESFDTVGMGFVETTVPSPPPLLACASGCGFSLAGPATRRPASPAASRISARSPKPSVGARPAASIPSSSRLSSPAAPCSPARWRSPKS